MAILSDVLLIAAALLLGAVIFSSLSAPTATSLSRIWLICSPLILMSRLHDLRRGLKRDHGGLPLVTLARLALWSTITGFLLAALLISLILFVGAA